MTARGAENLGRVLAIMLTVATLDLAQGCRSAAETPLPVTVDPVVRDQVLRGTARVIVELRIARGFRPEGELPDSAAVTAQRQAIAGARQRVLSRLRGTPFALVRDYASVPLLALEVGADALAALETLADVVLRVVADELSAPSGAAPARPSSGNATPGSR